MDDVSRRLLAALLKHARDTGWTRDEKVGHCSSWARGDVRVELETFPADKHSYAYVTICLNPAMQECDARVRSVEQAMRILAAYELIPTSGPAAQPPTSGDLRRTLASLGDTPGQVKASLLAGGHRGQRREAGRCPIASLLAAAFPGFEPRVTPFRARLVGDDGRTAARSELPPPVGLLVEQFDDGMHPELEV